MSDLAVLKAALQGRRPGTLVTVDSFRTELCEASQIPGSHLGPLFLEACAKGFLSWNGRTRKSVHKPARGRRVLEYVVLEQNRSAA